MSSPELTQKITQATAEIRQGISLLHLYGAEQEAYALSLDLTKAGDSYPEILMVMEDLERILEEASVDHGDVCG